MSIIQQGKIVKNEIKNSLCDENSVSNCSLLANVLESVVQNDIEKNKLNQYKEKNCSYRISTGQRYSKLILTMI